MPSQPFHSRKGSNYKSFDVITSLADVNLDVKLTNREDRACCKICSARLIVCLVLLTCFGLPLLMFIIQGFVENSCPYEASTPFLYFTRHGSHNIIKLSRDGCVLNERVLWSSSDGSTILSSDSSLRGMKFTTLPGEYTRMNI